MDKVLQIWDYLICHEGIPIFRNNTIYPYLFCSQNPRCVFYISFMFLSLSASAFHLYFFDCLASSWFVKPNQEEETISRVNRAAYENYTAVEKSNLLQNL